MVRRYPCQIVILFVLGILAVKGMILRQDTNNWEVGILLVLLSFAAALLLAGIWAVRERLWRNRLSRAAVLFAAFGMGMSRMHFVSKEMDQQLTGILDGQNIVVQGRIVKKQCKDTFDNLPDHTSSEGTNGARNEEIQNKETQEKEIQNIKQWTVYLTDTYLKTSNGIHFCGNVVVYLRDEEPVIGNIILLSGKSKLLQTARNDGNFDERAYYQNQGYSLKIYADDNSCQIMDDNHQDRVREFLYDLQQRFLEIFGRRMPQREAGALGAMLLGEKSLLSSQTKELYRQSGISHILAISGLHISILGASVFHLLRKRGISYPSASVVSMGLLVMFALMTGMGLSAVRAVVMFGIYLGAACVGRAYDSVNGLAVAGICILVCQPCALFLAGFQFSFAAVAGVLFGKEACRIFQPKLRLVQTVLISTGIQIMTLPLTAWYYFEIPVYSVLLNLLVLPLMEVVLITGLFGGTFGILAEAASVCGLLSDVLLAGCTLVLQYFTKAGEMFLKLPGAVCVLGQPKGWQMVFYYIMIAGCMWMIRGAADRDVVIKPMANRVQSRNVSGSLTKQKLAIGACFLFCFCLLFVHLPKQQEVTVLDVGQGDGIYIHTSDGMDIFIDGGSTNVKNVGTYRILPFLKAKGVSGIDLWFVSHLDKDHISGLEEIADSGYDIGSVILAKGILQDDAYHKMAGMLREGQISVQYMGKGDKLRGENTCFTCMWPIEGDMVKDRNARSMVLLYEDSGFSGFFSGDVSMDEEKKILADSSLPEITVYKAAHHGSKYSNSLELLQQIKPAISVVSCAEKNDYGHPGEEAVKNMEENSGSMYYTMNSGQIRICWGKRGSAVWEYLR